MGNITVKNLSSFANYAALARVARLMAGDEYYATHDSSGKEVVRITCKGNVYTVCDKEADNEK